MAAVARVCRAILARQIQARPRLSSCWAKRAGARTVHNLARCGRARTAEPGRPHAESSTSASEADWGGTSARRAELLTFEVAQRAQNTGFYLQGVWQLAPRITGKYRARGRVVQVPLPDPGEDDGHLISH